MATASVAAGAALLALLVSTPASLGAVAPTPGTLVVSDQEAFAGPGGVIRVDPGTGARTSLSNNGAPAGYPQFEAPTRLAVEADGNIVVAGNFTLAASSAPGVIRVRSGTGQRERVSLNGLPAAGPQFVDPRGIAVEASGDILVGDCAGGQIVRVDPQSGARSQLSSSTQPGANAKFRCPEDVAVQLNGDIIATDRLSDTVFRIDPVTGSQTVLTTDPPPVGQPNFWSPEGVTIGNSGDALVTDAGTPSQDEVVAVDPLSGTRDLVSDNSNPPGGPDLYDPMDIAPGSSGKLFVTSGDSTIVTPNPATGWEPRIIKVKRGNGNRSNVSTNAAPAGGPDLVDPWGIALAPIPVGPFQVKPPTFGVDNRKRRAVAEGTTFRYRLGKAAKVRIAIGQRLAGRIRGTTCRKPSPENSGGDDCTRYVLRHQIKVNAHRGVNRTRFSGVVDGHALQPGTYEARLLAVGKSGIRSVPVAAEFRVR